jgi:FkbM family methyltransferase
MIRTIYKGSTVVDVGANQGYFTMLMAKLVGNDGEGIAIEAFPSTYAILTDNLKGNCCPNVDAKQVAVTNSRGEIAIAAPWPQNLGSASIVADGHGRPEVIVKCDTLTSILAESAKRVSFIKIDTEGAERAPLLDILAHKDRFPRPLTVVAEISPDNAYLERAFRDEGFSAQILPHGYTLNYYLDDSEMALEPYSPPARRKTAPNDYLFCLV